MLEKILSKPFNASKYKVTIKRMDIAQEYQHIHLHRWVILSKNHLLWSIKMGPKTIRDVEHGIGSLNECSVVFCNLIKLIFIGHQIRQAFVLEVVPKFIKGCLVLFCLLMLSNDAVFLITVVVPLLHVVTD